ncbi:MAG: hypothetical protein KatS3mg109_1850 [Pirellulaceae bacterium]|nr:MAG: hypothetical protein KatS3mg109_1850 [Pirellulaceae bacterium]
MLDRLAGLETEYAIRFAEADCRTGESRFGLYQRLTERLRQVIPLARAYHFKDGWFLANGGAVWFEADRPASGAGLVEVSTPECRGPEKLLCYQRALDVLVSRAASSSAGAGPFWLVKNDRDGAGHVYGAQENYEVPIADGAALWLWRIGLVSLLPLVVVSWLGFYLLVGLLLVYLAVAGLLFLCIHRWIPDRRWFAALLFGRDLAEGRDSGSPTPPWMEWLVLNATRVLSLPLALALWGLCSWVAFRRARRALTPFLMSRFLLGGAGYVRRDGRFALADKADAFNCVVGFGGYCSDRPIYTMGHFFKALCAETLFGIRHYWGLFAPRQRLQIALGDSNMCEYAEYLKVGTTLLVLDAWEAGYLKSVPSLAAPLKVLRSWVADPTLSSRARTKDGQTVTALDVQWHYYEACRKYVAANVDASPEAQRLLDRWHEVLRMLADYQQRASRGEKLAQAARPLVGVLDWPTKLYLLDQLGPTASWLEKKKIDIRYHELSEEGYYQRLAACGLVRRLVSDAELDRAMRVPPPDSPATRRGHLIREFSEGDEPLRVHWRCVILGTGRRRRVIPLASQSRRGRMVAQAERPTGRPFELFPGSDDAAG